MNNFLKMIRKAGIKDAKKIQKLINYFAGKEIMLPRSLNQVYTSIRDFFVFEENGKILGCAALSSSWDDLAEIRSVAISKKMQKRGIGKELVNACLEEAKSFGFKKVFLLTYIPKYFMKFGFKQADRDKFPHRIWTECINCPKFPNCNEILMVKKL